MGNVRVVHDEFVPQITLTSVEDAAILGACLGIGLNTFIAPEDQHRATVLLRAVLNEVDRLRAPREDMPEVAALVRERDPVT